MELILDSTEGVPQSGLLSIKVGETKRQAPVSRLGQVFRFASSRAEPLPLQVELLAPVAPAQLLYFDPTSEHFDVNFGDGVSVRLGQRESQPLPPAPRVADVVASKGLPAQKLAAAQKAASYLDAHDLVRTFQEILHGLLVTKPEDPFPFVDQHLARAKQLRAQRRGICADAADAEGTAMQEPSADYAAQTDLFNVARTEFKAVQTDMVRSTGSDFKAVQTDLFNVAGTEFKAVQTGLVGSIGGSFKAVQTELSCIDGFEFKVGGAVCSTSTAESKAKTAEEARPEMAQSHAGADMQVGGAVSSTATAEPKTAVDRVEVLLELLQKTEKNLALVVPFLPEALRTTLRSARFATDCNDRFEKLDVEKRGVLSPLDLMPLIMDLSNARRQSVSVGQCQRFVNMFDSNEDGAIERDEFATLVKYVIVAAYLESEMGKRVVEKGQHERSVFENFMRILEGDRSRVLDLLPFLPEWLVSHVKSDDVMKEALASFDELDKDHSGELEPVELWPVIVGISKVDPVAVDTDKCEKFTRLFGVGPGEAVQREQFVEFTQFLLIANFLSSGEGREVEEVAAEGKAIDCVRAKKFIALLSEDRGKLSEVLQSLPEKAVAELTSSEFASTCREEFNRLDDSRNGVLDPSELFPILVSLCEANSINVGLEDCQQFTAIFDDDKKGVITLSEFVELAQFIVVMGYLSKWKGDQAHQDARVDALLSALKDGTERLDVVLECLPEGLTQLLSSQLFAEQCLEDFAALDKDDSGALDSHELIPVIRSLSHAKDETVPLTGEQCRRFVSLFDLDGTGVITRTEYVNLVRFLLIMSFLETDEGQEAANSAEIALGMERVEGVLAMLEHDRKAFPKAVPLLPEDIFQHLSSDEFILQCRERFAELDKDHSGSLDPSELFPVVVELSAAHPFSVDLSQCARFAAIFDVKGDGVICLDEFVDFARFLSMMSFLHSREGRARTEEGLRVMADSKKIEELLLMMQRDHRHMHKVVPYLPDWLKEELLDESFAVTCLERFSELDKDNNGYLEPAELFDMIISMTTCHPSALDLSQCERFTAIFDNEGKGLISRKEFVHFARFLLVMGFLQTEDGEKTLELFHHDASRAGGSQMEEYHEATESTERERVRAERLAQENDQLLNRIGTLEQTLQEMSTKLELQEERLKGVQAN